MQSCQQLSDKRKTIVGASVYAHTIELGEMCARGQRPRASGAQRRTFRGAARSDPCRQCCERLAQRALYARSKSLDASTTLHKVRTQLARTNDRAKEASSVGSQDTPQ